MGEVTTIGLDLAKHVFQVHGVDAEGATVLRKLANINVVPNDVVPSPDYHIVQLVSEMRAV
jgi:hypothetical protein